MSAKRILVIGGTGGVGKHVVSQLLSLPSPPPLRVSSRDPSKIKNLPTTVEVVKGDSSDSSTYPSLFKNIDKIFLYVQGLGEGKTNTFLAAAKEAGVEHVVFLSSQSVLFPENFIGKMHSAVEEAIKEFGFTYTFLRATGFNSNLFHFITPQIRSSNKVYLPYLSSSSLSLISDEDIASVAVVALSSSRLDNQCPFLTGPESLTSKEQLEILIKVRMEKEGKGFEYEEVSPEKWKEHMLATTNFPEFGLNGMILGWKASENKPSEVSPAVKQITGKSLYFSEWAKIHFNELF